MEQKAFNTRPEKEERMLIVLDKSTHEINLSQPLQTNIEEYKYVVTFLTVFNGISKVTNKNRKFHFATSITDENGFVQRTIPTCAYELESLNDDNKGVNIEKGHFT